MTTEAVSPDLLVALRRLKLSGLLATLPERLSLARAQVMPYQDFLLLLLTDEATRRDGLATTLRAARARLDPSMQLEAWDATAKVTYDKMLLNELVSLRFLESHAHVAIVGPVGVGKTFLAHALGHVACRRGYSVLALRSDAMLKTLRHARRVGDAVRRLTGAGDWLESSPSAARNPTCAAAEPGRHRACALPRCALPRSRRRRRTPTCRRAFATLRPGPPHRAGAGRGSGSSGSGSSGDSSCCARSRTVLEVHRARGHLRAPQGALLSTSRG
jgi:hypothetical protein